MSGGDVETRDSTGVRIVENHAPAEPDQWTVSSLPMVRFPPGGLRADQPLQPVSVFEDGLGRILVADGGAVGSQAVWVFDRAGTRLHRFGRAGEGPGEFGRLAWARPYRGDSIAALDRARNEVSIFTTEGGFARRVGVPSGASAEREGGAFYLSPYLEAPLGDGSFLAMAGGTAEAPERGDGPGWMYMTLLRVAPDGDAWTALGQAPANEAFWSSGRPTRLPFAAFGAWAPTSGGFVGGTGDRAGYAVRDLHGAVQMLVRRDHTPVPIDAEDESAYVAERVEVLTRSPEWSPALVEARRRTIEKGYFPEAKPAFSRLVVGDEGEVWMEHYRIGGPDRPSPMPTEWSVFSPDGRWLTTVELPARFLLGSVSGDRLYGFQVDDLDVRHVVAYGLERRPG